MFFQFKPLLLLLQNEAQTATSVDPNQSLNSWLVIAGIIIIFFCLVTVFVPNIKDFITKPQEFNVSKLGVSMKVSILTVFVLMGFILSLSSFALQWRNYVKQARESAGKIAELNGTIKQLQTTINETEAKQNRGRTFNMSILVRPRLDEEYLKKDDWTCTYWLDNKGQPSEPVTAPIGLARRGTHLRVFLNDITLDTRLYDLQLKRGNQYWNTDSFSPLTEGIWEAELLPGGSQ